MNIKFSKLEIIHTQDLIRFSLPTFTIYYKTGGYRKLHILTIELWFKKFIEIHITPFVYITINN